MATRREWLVVGLVAAGAAVARADGATGVRVYAERCSVCHGSEGGGDGPAAAALTPRPRNFRPAEFWAQRTPAQIREAVARGRPGTLMGAFEGVLTPEEIDAVVDHLRRFAPAGAGARAREAPARRPRQDAARPAPRS